MPQSSTSGRTANPSPGEVVQGRVVASEGRQVTLRLTDGSTWQARLSEGVQLETGTVVRLEVGERVDGIPTARVMEQHAGTSTTGNALEAEIGEAFRTLGTRVMPELMEKALLLMQESGMKSEQAAFLAANGLEGDAALRGLLDRMVGGSFGFADNWFDLASGLSTAIGTMPEGERAALSQSLVLFEAVDQLAQTLHAGQQGMTPAGEAGHVATSPVVPAEEMALLRQVLLSWAGQLPEPETALRILQTLPGVLPETLFPATDPAMAATTGSSPAAGTGNPGEGDPLVGAAGQELPSAEMGRTAAAGMMAGNSAARNAVVPAEQAEVNTPVVMEGPTHMSLSTLSPQARDWLSQLFSQISALSLQAREAPVPDATQLQLRVLEAFEQAVLKVEAGQNPAQRALDAEMMAKVLGERLEWAATALESLTRETAAPLQPLMQDAVDAMRLFNQISTLHTFLEIPLRLNGEQAQGELYVMKRKGNRGRIDPSDFTLFLVLDTMHVGHLETLAHARNNRVTLRFEVPDEGIRDLVREMRKGLDDGLVEKGFQLVDMRVHVASEKGVSPLNAAREAQHRLGLLGRVDVRL